MEPACPLNTVFNVGYGILADDRGDLWMSANKGIAKAILSREQRTVERFKIMT